ncbi:MAG: Ni/Fe-hydrogenase cytochrome b subunit [candidate division KSB1 bacterium]|nr:Ni/Fe-hydrogenase cytochrome b subunit [candidate division KSB1 bacterium]MDZ7274283.1 Ni/Fe-hydrogenase cytochrome b subunit [candidate division KSB1 bacterium]MDZ7287195.1 Ni/Fe-hydrogenase cytochrome b subunit [candidate division KSB1 bacterium]MDZ7296880.1 Ni/Fe-hydrogenase cytochrome b subunit [candidate division KSB1 bacterium]MDZ7306015.1 Ni/Fe-hydrogenase cytochrome b subunit [candidate division KSB1 bacterium]
MKKLLGQLTFWRAVLVMLLGLGLYATYVRFTQGLGAATNLSDQFPWGLWIGFDILCGVGLAAGGFTLCAIVYIFNIQAYKAVIRPAVLTAFLGYLLVIFALLYDLGRPERIWHAIVMWNPSSVMFEVAWCVMLYTTVLALEFSPILFEKLGWERPLRIVRAITVPLVIVGVLLSTLHQSSLGSLYLIVPEKLHPLWYSSLLPVFFFVSAIGAGCAMVIFESFMSSRAFKREIEMPQLAQLGRVLVVILMIYTVMKLQDLADRRAWVHVVTPTLEAMLYWAEMGLGVLLPMILLARPHVRRHPTGLFCSALLVVLGFVLNRMNVSITGMEAWARAGYFPSWMEIAVTMMIVALGITAFALAARHLPVFSPTAREEKTTMTESPHLAWAE